LYDKKILGQGRRKL